MEDPSFLSQEPSSANDGIAVPGTLSHQMRHARTPPLNGTTTQHQTYSTLGPYGNYPMSTFDSSLPTPVSGAGSPLISEDGSSEMPNLKHERRSSIQQSPPICSRGDWQFNNAVAYNSQPDSPSHLQQHGLSPYHHGMDGSEHQEHRPLGPDGHVSDFWPSPALHSGQLPYSMSMATIPSSAFARPHELAPGQTMPSMHLSPHHHHHQVGESYEHQPYRDMGPSPANIHHHYPSLNHHQQPVMLGMNELVSRTPQKSPRSRSKAAKGASGRSKGQRSRNKSSRGSGSTDKSSLYSKNPEDRLKLDEKTKEQDLFLYTLRCELDDLRGDSMWDIITTRYSLKYGPKAKEALQMQLTRARAILADVMKRIVPTISEEMKERGSAWPFTPEQVLSQLHREGFVSMDESITPQRSSRRTKLSLPKQSKSRGTNGSDMQAQRPLTDLTPDQFEFIMSVQARHECFSSESDSMPEGSSYDAFMDSDGGDIDPGLYAGMASEAAIHSAQSYAIAQTNGSVVAF